MYKKAGAGEIKNFTGVNAPFKAPENPEIIIKIETEKIEASAQRALAHVQTELMNLLS